MVAFNKKMNNRRLDALIRKIATEVQGELGYWQFHYEGRQLMVVTDEVHDRMRVMTPVVEEFDLTVEDCKTLLSANFNRALDAKFALSGGYLWSLFVHPLGDLSSSQFVDAVDQVKTLADNYGTSYSSSEVVFGGD